MTVLPDLPLRLLALRPHISRRIMELHHGKHHANYVAGARTPRWRAGRRPRDQRPCNQPVGKNLAFNLGDHATTPSSGPA